MSEATTRAALMTEHRDYIDGYAAGLADGRRIAPQPAVPVVSDEQIESCALAAGFSIEPSTGAIWAVDGCGSTRVDPGLRKFARAILALRPAVGPMTPEQVGKAYYLAQDKKGHEPTFVDGIAAAEAHHFGFDRIAQLEAK